MDRKTKNNYDSDSQGHQSDSQIESIGLPKELKQKFLDILMKSKYNKPKHASFEYIAKKFIAELDSYLPAAKWRLSTEPVDITRGRRKQKAGLKALNKAIKHFEEALMVMYPGITSEDAAAWLSHSLTTAELYKSRDKFVEALSPKSAGPPPRIKTYIPESPGDVNNIELPDRMQEVIQHIVYLFWMHLGKPSLYRKGPLFIIVGKTLELLQQHQKDLYNRIKTAVKTLTTYHPHLLSIK